MSDGPTSAQVDAARSIRARDTIGAGLLVGGLAALLVIGLSWEPRHVRGVRMLPHTVVARYAIPEVPEPSGIAYHAGRGTLIVVGDGGQVAEITPDGVVLRLRDMNVRNLEAVAVDPVTGLIYVAVEEAEQIIELRPDTLETTRRIHLDRDLDGRTVLASGGQETGIEGLAFAPDADHPEGGTFYVLNQAFSNHDSADASAILQFEAPLRSSAERRLQARIIRYWPQEIPDLAAADWDASRGRLWVVSDQLNLLMQFDPASGAVERRWRLPGVEQEGFALDSSGQGFIAQDVGGLIRIRLHRPTD